MAAAGSFMQVDMPTHSHFDWRKNITCRYFIHGMCREGERCAYAHYRSDPGVKSNVCRYYLQGKCLYGEACKFQHVAPANQKTSGPSPTVVSVKDKDIKSNLTTLGQSGKEESENAQHQDSGSKYRMADLINAKEFIPGQPFQGSLPPTYSAAAKKTGESNALVISAEPDSPGPPQGVLCPYAMKGTCRYGTKCLYMHGEVCDLCGEACLMPFDDEQNKQHRLDCLKKHEKEMQEAFLYQQSKDIVCGICMETIMDKSPRERKFGILSDCTHPYCLDCIRKWRSGKQFEKTIIRGCPTCRKMSNFVTPSDYWVEDPEEKLKLIEKYKAALSSKPCKYFDQGNGKCPFGADCFYLHAFPDGTKEDRSKIRHCRSSSNKIKTLRPHLLWEFFEQRNSLFDFGSDEDDFFLFGSSLWHDEWDYFSELSEADDFLDYLQYMGSDGDSENDFDSDWSGDIPTSGDGEENVGPLEEGHYEDGEVDADDEWEEGNEDGNGGEGDGEDEGEEREAHQEVEEEEEEDVEEEEEEDEEEIVVGGICIEEGGVLCDGAGDTVKSVQADECGYSEEDSQYSDCVDW
ncbi:probable E3 ubiquitin-protein ligase makorin-1 [Diadema antillarum]|uniref:probable E3 ubiquitin-protein ligase makorin-1 n=1 Tax=Diadema antillarum TaxID=105358 RepID=UPI003A87BF55